MFDACILSAFLLTTLPTQLTPEGMEAAKRQEIRDYYARWVGVPAPELGPKVKDRLNGPPIRLNAFRGKRLLLFAFDSGDFVGGGPGLEAVHDNLEQLNCIRSEIDADAVAVIGFTEGPIFFFPTKLRTERQREVSEMATFPIVNSIRAQHRKLNQPYNMLARPGGIMIDRNGVIVAVYTEQLTEKEIRGAVTASDWSGPLRPAPVNDPWSGRKRPTPLMKAVEKWSKEVAAPVALTRGDWDADGIEDVLVLRADDGLSVLDTAGREKLVVPVEAIWERHLTIECGRNATGQSVLMQCRGGWPRKVPIYSESGTELWAYPANNIGGIDSATWVDIDGDGSSELLVGFSAYTGLHLVSSDGKERWTNTDVKTRWTVSGFDARNGRPGLALSTGSDKAIRIYDAEGRYIRSIGVDGKHIFLFAAAEMTRHGDRQVLFIEKATVGTIDHAVAADLDGNILWRYPIVAFRLRRIPPAIVAADVTGDGTKEWVFQCSANQVVAVNARGQLVARFPTPRDGATLITAVGAGPGEPELVVLGNGDKLVAYAVSNTGSP